MPLNNVVENPSYFKRVHHISAAGKNLYKTFLLVTFLNTKIVNFEE